MYNQFTQTSKQKTPDSSRGMEGQITRIGDSSNRVVGLIQALRKKETKDLLNQEENILETLGMMSKPNTYIGWMKVPSRMKGEMVILTSLVEEREIIRMREEIVARSANLMEERETLNLKEEITASSTSLMEER